MEQRIVRDAPASRVDASAKGRGLLAAQGSDDDEAAAEVCIPPFWKMRGHGCYHVVYEKRQSSWLVAELKTSFTSIDITC